MNFRDYANKVNKINPRNIIINISNELSYEFVELNKQQLMEGKSSIGDNLRPSYLQDTYFKSIIAATKYKKWKQKITPNPKRNPNAPNLYITGKFHSGFHIKKGGEEFIIDSNDKNTGKIKSKYNHVFGLTPENIENEKAKVLRLCWNQIIKYLN